MKDYIFLLITSTNCFHCKNMRGNGMMGNKTFFMRPTILDNILSKNDKLIYLNIHFGRENGTFNNICEISKIYKSGDFIEQEIWSENEKKILYKSITADKKNKNVKIKHIKNLNKSWDKFLNEKIPKKIENYTYFYPCFFISKKDNWIECIKNSSKELLGITNSGKTVQDKDGKIYLNPQYDDDSIDERILSPTELIEEGITKNKIQVHIKNDF